MILADLPVPDQREPSRSLTTSPVEPPRSAVGPPRFTPTDEPAAPASGPLGALDPMQGPGALEDETPAWPRSRPAQQSPVPAPTIIQPEMQDDRTASLSEQTEVAARTTPDPTVDPVVLPPPPPRTVPVTDGVPLPTPPAEVPEQARPAGVGPTTSAAPLDGAGSIGPEIAAIAPVSPIDQSSRNPAPPTAPSWPMLAAAIAAASPMLPATTADAAIPPAARAQIESWAPELAPRWPLSEHELTLLAGTGTTAGAVRTPIAPRPETPPASDLEIAQAERPPAPPPPVPDLAPPIPAPVPEAVTAEPTAAPPVPAAADSAPPAAPARNDAVARAGGYLVQLASLQSEERARTSRETLKQELATVLGERPLYITTADLGDRGLYYRVSVGNFDDAESARAYCAELKASGADCVVINR